MPPDAASDALAVLTTADAQDTNTSAMSETADAMPESTSEDIMSESESALPSLPPVSDMIPVDPVAADVVDTMTSIIEPQASTALLPPSRARKGKDPAPIDTSSLRRSTRSTKYDGFRVKVHDESRPSKSKVKPMVVPTMLHHGAASDSMETEFELPPPTPIPTMQNIGTQLCAIPAEELTEDMLTAGEDGVTSASSP